MTTVSDPSAAIDRDDPGTPAPAGEDRALRLFAVPDDGGPRESETIRVYVAEDHPVFLEGLLSHLSRRTDLQLTGHAVDGETALEQITALHPDVAVLDMRMPGLDGPQILEELRRREVPTRVLFLSAMLERETVYAAVAAGASAYLSKNATPDEICGGIEAVARGETVIPSELVAGLAEHIRERERAPAPDPSPALTPRELEVLTLMAEGCSAPEIGRRLHLSPTTIKTHMKRSYEKLGVSERAAAIAEAMRHGLLR